MGLTLPRVPSYFDGLIEGFRRGHAGRDVHLGYWDDPPPLSTPCSAQEFEDAQARLTDLLIELAALRDQQDVLDVGCGFGGALEAIGQWREMRRTGVNIDPRQLDICRSLPMRDGSLALIEADACALPLQAASFDRAICIEAMFHFRSREAFLHQVARVLRPGGRLAVSDILLRAPGAEAPTPVPDIEAILRSEFGPWPQLWIEPEELISAAARAGLRLERRLDATRATLPSYRVTAPQNEGTFPRRPSAGHLLRWLHANGHLTYLCAAFSKT